MTVPMIESHSTLIECAVVSYGYLHLERTGRPLPKADIVVDVRDHLRDPHIDPAFRQLDGFDPRIVEKVLTTPGASELIDALVNAAAALLPGASRTGRLIKIAIGCAGGRHRSVVITNSIASRLALRGFGVESEHWHVNEPVVRGEKDTPCPQ